MLNVRAAQERGHANHGWLDTYHSFSFADYYDPHFMGFRQLRVINEDVVAPAMGFGTHPHRDMEIITYVLEGSLEHRDSLGSGGVITPGEVQHMSAGRGIRHSEFNHSKQQDVHLLQIWLLPDRTGIEPKYQQKAYPIAAEKDRLHLVASPEGRDGSLPMQSDAELYVAQLSATGAVEHRYASGRHGWLQVARGSVSANGVKLGPGDGLAITDEERLTVEANGEAEVLLFDLD